MADPFEQESTLLKITFGPIGSDCLAELWYGLKKRSCHLRFFLTKVYGQKVGAIHESPLPVRVVIHIQTYIWRQGRFLDLFQQPIGYFFMPGDLNNEIPDVPHHSVLNFQTANPKNSTPYPSSITAGSQAVSIP